MSSTFGVRMDPGCGTVDLQRTSVEHFGEAGSHLEVKTAVQHGPAPRGYQNSNVRGPGNPQSTHQDFRSGGQTVDSWFLKVTKSAQNHEFGYCQMKRPARITLTHRKLLFLLPVLAVGRLSGAASVHVIVRVVIWQERADNCECLIT